MEKRFGSSTKNANTAVGESQEEQAADKNGKPEQAAVQDKKAAGSSTSLTEEKKLGISATKAATAALSEAPKVQAVDNSGENDTGEPKSKKPKQHRGSYRCNEELYQHFISDYMQNDNMYVLCRFCMREYNEKKAKKRAQEFMPVKPSAIRRRPAQCREHLERCRAFAKYVNEVDPSVLLTTVPTPKLNAAAVLSPQVAAVPPLSAVKKKRAAALHVPVLNNVAASFSSLGQTGASDGDEDLRQEIIKLRQELCDLRAKLSAAWEELRVKDAELLTATKGRIEAVERYSSELRKKDVELLEASKAQTEMMKQYTALMAQMASRNNS
ncbi:hypothetical protein ACA910_020261 [Epithemia clementina (nom. ined.)]